MLSGLQHSSLRDMAQPSPRFCTSPPCQGVHTQSFLWSQPSPTVTRPEFLAAVSLHPPQCLKSFSSSQASQVPFLNLLHVLHTVCIYFSERMAMYIWDPLSEAPGLWVAAGSHGPLPSRAPAGSKDSFLPTRHSRPALKNTLTESLLCPLGIVSQKSLMSELCI